VVCQASFETSVFGLAPESRLSEGDLEALIGSSDAFKALSLCFVRHSPFFEPREEEIEPHSLRGKLCDKEGTPREELAAPHSPLFAWHSLLFAPRSLLFEPFELGGMEPEEVFG